MSHPDDLLSALLDGELDAVEHAYVASHLRECGECQLELSDLAVARTALRGLPILDVPPSIFAPAAEVIPLRPRRRVMTWSAASAAALALVVGLAVSGGDPAPAADLDTLAEQHTARVVIDPGFATIRMTVEGE